MADCYTVALLKGGGPAVRLPPAAAERLGLAGRRTVTISFGLQARPAVLRADPGLPAGELRVSPALARALRLPLRCVYELAARGGELRLGPCVGILAAREAGRLTSARLRRLLSYEEAYRGLHGALLVFALDGMRPGGRLVDGYCYDPFAHDFVWGRYPFPAAVYRRVGLRGAWKGRFCSLLGDRFFNAVFFNKWQLYRWAAEDSSVAPHLPETRLYRTEEDFFAMLARHGTLYLKPAAGLGGHGVWRARAEGAGVVFTGRAGGRACTERASTRAQAAAFLRRRLSPGRSLVQQALSLLEIRGGPADFRCVMQKDQTACWRCKAVIGRHGRRGSVVSNIRSGGSAFLLRALAPGELELPAADAAGLEAALRAFSLGVCAALDRCGLGCGTLGLDVGVDISGRLWLIEVNNRAPDPSIALDVGDRALYDEIRAGPLFYAKALAGFPLSAEE